VKRPGFLARWLGFFSAGYGQLGQRQALRNPDADRLRQRQAARDAFLSQLNPGQRSLAMNRFEDIR
jgi:hypothetical protein